MTVKTIEEALAKCPRHDMSVTGNGCRHGKVRTSNDAFRGPSVGWVECTECNGTGYACGIAPTEVERHLFAIVQATRALIALGEHVTGHQVLDYCAHAFAAHGPGTVHATPVDYCGPAEAIALSGRGDDDD